MVAGLFRRFERTDKCAAQRRRTWIRQDTAA